MLDLCSSPLDVALQKVMPDASVVKTELPLTRQIKLWLLDPLFHHHPYSSEESAAIMNDPPYWSFCWASGQVLARYILDQPELVAGKRVIDFGAGSGVVGIACILAGAERVVACDIDADARLACMQNAADNDVTLATCASLDQIPWKPDLIFAADVLYDLENYRLLEEFLDITEQVVIADSRAKSVAPHLYQLLDVRDATTLPDYGEFDEFKRVKIYRSRP